MKNKNDYPNIVICSYNIYWKLMDLSNTTLNYIKPELLAKYKQNTLTNITNTINYYNPHIYCFQEAASYPELIKLFDKNIYDYYVNKSGKEYMLTIYNKNKFTLLYSISGEFESGRPFCICIFNNETYNYNFMLINIHAGHDIDTNTSIFKHIQDCINKIDKCFLNIKRIIIAGDFNRNVENEINNNSYNYYLLINDDKFIFYNFYNNKNTCCNIYGNKLDKNYDYIIESLERPILTHNLSDEKWYTYPSSDHTMIMTIIKN